MAGDVVFRHSLKVNHIAFFRVFKGEEKRCRKSVPRAGIEPAQYCYRGILSPLCLPIPPPGQGQENYIFIGEKASYLFFALKVKNLKIR